MRVFLIVLFALSVNENAGSSNNSIEGSLFPLMENPDWNSYYVALANVQFDLVSGGIILSPYWVLSSTFDIEYIEFVFYGSSTFSSNDYMKQKFVAIRDKYADDDNVLLIEVDTQLYNIGVLKLPNQDCKHLNTANKYRIVFWKEDQLHGNVISTFIEPNSTSAFNDNDGNYRGMRVGAVMVINDVEIYGVKVEPNETFICLCNSLEWIKNETNLK